MSDKATISVISGPNEGDSVTVEAGFCRLVGRHLSDNETALIDRDGNRILDGGATELLSEHLKEKAPVVSPATSPTFSAETFERGADIILADDSISRAHAMVFFDNGQLGLIDLASTNGTFVNDSSITTAVLQNGDQIDIGNSKLQVDLGAKV